MSLDGNFNKAGVSTPRLRSTLCQRTFPMIEPLLCGIVLGLIPITLLGLFVSAWNQYRRGSALGG